MVQNFKTFTVYEKCFVSISKGNVWRLHSILWRKKEKCQYFYYQSNKFSAAQIYLFALYTVLLFDLSNQCGGYIGFVISLLQMSLSRLPIKGAHRQTFFHISQWKDMLNRISRRSIWCIILGYILFFQNRCYGYSIEASQQGVFISTNNMGFYGELEKIIPKSSPNTPH